jgi:hypothetical protein
VIQLNRRPSGAVELAVGACAFSSRSPALVLGALLAGCGTQKSECSSTLECDPGTHCVDGRCGFECSIDYDCRSPDLRCDDRGRCVPVGGGDADADADTDADGCDVGRAESFGATMIGCPGAVAWSDRYAVCPAGWYPCSAAEWVARHGSTAPTFDYWTDDDLRYDDAPPDCWVDETIGSTCPGEPMRVCTPAGVDAFGNGCNWQNCGYHAAPPPDHFFGGCSGNATAGVLCCD